MNVALSVIIALRSSGRSVTIQSSLRGKMAVSREMTDLLCQNGETLDAELVGLKYYLVRRALVKHIACTLNTEKLAGDPDDAVRARCTSIFGRQGDVGTNQTLQRRREIDIGPSFLLDGL